MRHDSTVIMNIFSRNGVSLERLQALERVVNAGGISLAANGDPSAQSLISRQIAELEEALGIALLNRSAKPYLPTDAARILAESCLRFVRSVEEVSAEAVDGMLPLRVGAGELVIRELLIPWIGKQKKGKDFISWSMHNLTSKRIQADLAAEKLDVGISAGLTANGTVRVKNIADYGMKLVLPEHLKPDKSGWSRLAGIYVVLLEGGGRFRAFLGECERLHGIKLRVGAECTSYVQAVELAQAAGWAVFVPELRWKRSKEWVSRTQKLPGLDDYRHLLKLGWNELASKRRPEVDRLIKELGGKTR